MRFMEVTSQAALCCTVLCCDAPRMDDAVPLEARSRKKGTMSGGANSELPVAEIGPVPVVVRSGYFGETLSFAQGDRSLHRSQASMPMYPPVALGSSWVSRLHAIPSHRATRRA
ncbi:hypothetical protein LIA77_11177 [Sarocladium implicatum]|nr:hypothetical protein LIA77_11177 [Sarocladium implicatum]